MHFSKFSPDFVNWNAEMGQQEKNVLSSMVRKEIQFFKQKLRIRHGKTKFRKFSDFHYFRFESFWSQTFEKRSRTTELIFP